MKKLYPRICSSCGRGFIGKKMDYTCPICLENKRVTIEQRDLRNSELGQIMRVETRGFCPIAPHIFNSR